MARIVVVDDNEELLTFTQRVLSNNDHTVELFSDPHEAIKRIKDTTREDIDVVITDYNLNCDITGVYVARTAVQQKIAHVILRSSVVELIPQVERDELVQKNVRIMQKDPFKPLGIGEVVKELLESRRST